MPVGPLSRSIAKNSNALLGQAPTPQSVGFVGGNDPGVFNAFDYPDLVSWVDANVICANIGQQIQAVPDLAAGGTRHYNKAGTPPTFGYVSGRPALIFDLTTNGLVLSPGVGTFTAPWTIVAVSQNLLATSDAGTHCLWAVAGTFIHFWQINDVSAITETIIDNGGSFQTNPGIGPLDTTRRITVWQETGTNITVRSNGVQTATNGHAAANSPTGSTAIGSRNGVDRPWVGSIQEFLVFRGTNLMDSVTLTRLERALGKKWSITIP